MAYVSPQVEGRIKKQNVWICQKCGFNENHGNLTQCQYCGFLRFDPMQQQPSQQPPQQFNNNNYNENVNVNYVQQSQPQQSQIWQPSVTTSVNVNVNNNDNKNDNNKNKNDYKQFVNQQQYKPFYDDDNNNDEDDDEDDHKNIGCCCCSLRLFLWLTICGGLVTSIWWLLCSLIYCFWFKACFKISKYLLFGQCTKSNDIKLNTKCSCYDSKGSNERNCCCDLCFVSLWMLIFGIPSFALHLIFGIISLPFLLFGFKFSVIHFRILKVSLFNPFAVEIKTRR